jgi:hypothetical protein
VQLSGAPAHFCNQLFIVLGNCGGQRTARPTYRARTVGRVTPCAPNNNLFCHTNVTLIVLPIRLPIRTFKPDHACRR